MIAGGGAALLARLLRPALLGTIVLCSAVLCGACAGGRPTRLGADAAADTAALAAAISRRPVAIVGETHDNQTQHRLRAAALRQVYERGARPALAFEQFDRERQAEIDRVRAERAAGGDNDELAARIAALGARGWNWSLYLPYVRIALDYGVPIVAANLSRPDAMRVVSDGFDAAFDRDQQHALALDRLPAQLLAEQEREIDVGHCHALPADELAPLARAQVARDAAMAQAIAPYAAGGVILLTGNGHARRDVGVARYLASPDRIVTIGLLEDDGNPGDLASAGAFDARFSTVAQPRADPCVELRRKVAPGAATDVGVRTAG